MNRCFWIVLSLFGAMMVAVVVVLAVADLTAQSYNLKQSSGGQLIGEWNSRGHVSYQDGVFRFRDRNTSRIVYISGDVLVTVKE